MTTKRLFVLALEGTRTEPQYFEVVVSKSSHSAIKIFGGNRSDPKSLLKSMKRYLSNSPIGEFDEAWIVIDRDNWTDAQISEIFRWTLSDSAYSLALSNPKFEFWLLLHFCDAVDCKTSQECDTQIRRYIPNYDKSIQRNLISLEGIKLAVSRAKTKDYPPCNDWPREPGNSTVYRLVEKIISDPAIPERM